MESQEPASPISAAAKRKAREGNGRFAPLMSSARRDWRTPENVLRLVRKMGDDSAIGLDPATSPENPTLARAWYAPPLENGLLGSWVGYGLVFCNPPYGRELKHWAAKMSAFVGVPGDHLIGLVPARTDTKWFRQIAATADAICFWYGRLRFVGAPASAPFPSALPYWGPYFHEFKSIFDPYGWVLRTR